MIILHRTTNTSLKTALLSASLTMLMGLSTGYAAVSPGSSLLAAAPSTDLGKNSSPVFSDDQVNGVGAFTYSYPLKFPVGRHDAQPLIGLSYSSDAPLSGGLAAGWSLNIPSIVGDTSRGTLDASGNNPAQSHYISNFRSGGKLIRQGDSPLNSNNVEVYYALHDDQYIRYELDKSSGLTYHWRVKTPDGYTYLFGQRIHHDAYNAPLYRIIDPFGHVIQYRWETVFRNFTGGATEDVLTQIEYRSSRDAQAYVTVAFDYSEQRCGGVHGFPVGARLDYRLSGQNDKLVLKGSQQLDSITINARRPQAAYNGDLVLGTALTNVRTYKLTYSDETAACDHNLGAPLRRLDSIAEIATAPVTGHYIYLPPTQFQYGDFAPAQNMRYQAQDYTDLKLPEGRDQEHFGEGLSGVSQVLIDLNGDGLQDLLRRPVGSLDQANLAYIYYNTGNGFSQQFSTVSFPQWLPNTVPDPESPLYQNKSLGLSGQLKFYADHSDDFLDGICDFDLSDRKGSLETFGLFDVNHDGLVDLVTALHYDPVRVSGAQFGLPQAEISAKLVPDDPGVDPNICGLGVQRVRWPSWKVRYNLGNGFSAGVDVVHGPLALPAISPSLSMGSSNPRVIIGRDGNGDFNGDGFKDRLLKGYKTPDEEDFHYDAHGFFVPKGDTDELGDRERWLTLGLPDGSLQRVTGVHWQLPLEWLSAVKEFGPGNATGVGDHYFATTTGLLDVNADGLDDLVMTKLHAENPDWQFGYYINNGHSFSGEMIRSGDNFTADSLQYFGYAYSQVSAQQLGLPTTGVSENKVLPSDINFDGLVDLVRIENDGIYVYANNGYQFATTPVVLQLAYGNNGENMSERLRQGLRGLMYMGIESEKQWQIYSAYLDMNGDGLKDIVNTVDVNTGEKKLYAATPEKAPFRLHSISNGKGALTKVHYTSTADQETVVQGENAGATYTVRDPKWVVQSVTVHSGSNQSIMQTNYTYRYPEFTADLFGRYALRGFKQRVKVAPSGAQVVDVFDYSQHYAGLHTEQVTYQAEDLENPHSILIKDYGAGFTALHDYDAEMQAAPKNWPLVQSTSYNCTEVNYLQCLDQGEKLSNETLFTTLNYAGDGISSSVAAIRVPATLWTKFDDGFGLERQLRGTKVHQIRADADEYLVRLKTDVVHDYSTATRRIVAHTSNLWNNGLRELGINAEYIYVDDKKIGTKTTRYAYNELGMVTHKIDPKEYAERGSGAPGTRLEYDAMGVTVTQVTNPLGHSMRAVTDIGTGATLLAQGPNASINSDGATVYARNKQVVDGLGRPLERYVSVDDALQGYRDVLTERYTYADKPTYYNRVYGYAVTREQLVADEQYAATMTVFDGIGRERYVEEYALETADAETHYHWDHAGNLVTIEVPDPSNEGAQVAYSYEYDSLERPVRTTGPDGSVLAVTRYEGLTTIRGEIGETNAPAAEKRLATNMAGQLYKVAEKLDNGHYATTRYRYNGAGHMQHITDPEGLATQLKHDTAGRRILIASGGQSWRYEYDHGDNMTALINPHSEGTGDAYTTRYKYDMLNRLTKRIPAQADLTEQEKLDFAWGVVTHVYDQAHPSLGESSLNYIGRLGYSSSPLVTNKYRYDAQGNISELRQTLDVTGLGDASGVELVRGSQFHSDGAQQSLTVYDAAAKRAISGQLHYEYDSRGLPLRLAGDKELARLVRNHAGLVKQRRIDHAANSIGVNYAYDAQGRITVLNVGESFNNSRPFTQWFGYYANGMVRTIQEKPADGEFRNMYFTWDTRHQLLSAVQNQDWPGYEGRFDYDAAGRLHHAQVHLRSTDPEVLAGTRVPQRDVEYHYDPVDPQRLDKLLNEDGSIHADYNYDLSGNVISRSVGDDVWAMRYDGENRLRRVEHQRAGQTLSIESYYYDGSSRVLSVHSDGTVRRWFGDAEVHYRNGAHERDWYYAQLGQTVARIENGSEVELMIQTPQGHEALSIDTEGALQAGKLYGPFGEVLYSKLADDKSDTDYTREFNGKDYDRASGLHYYGNRYYDPVAVMWNRADPLYRFAPDQGYDEPRRMNLYVFTLNNPISLVDPDGLDANDTMGMSGIVILEYAITDAREAIYKNPDKAIKALPKKVRKKIKGWVKDHIIDQLKNQAGYEMTVRYQGYGIRADHLTGSFQAVRNKRLTKKVGKRLRKVGLKFATLDAFVDAVIAAETMVKEELDDVTRELADLKKHSPDDEEAEELEERLKRDKKSLQGKVKKLSEISSELAKLLNESQKDLNSIFEEGKHWLDDKTDRQRL